MVVVRQRTFAEYGDEEFWFLPNGHIECNSCHTYWCGHIEAFVKDHADAETMWGIIDEARSERNYQHIELPVVPTANIWAELSLTFTDLPGNPMQVNLVRDGGQVYEIGFTHPGEGRLVLRSMVFDWFATHVYTENLKCEKVSHGFNQEMLWVKDMKAGGASRAAQFWSVWLKGGCLGCVAGDANWSADLIPDPSSSSTRRVF